MPEPTSRTPANATGTQTLQRAAVLLRLVSAHHRQGVRLVDLYRKAGLERPTAHRILQGLIAEQLVRQDPETRRYHLGSLVYEMGLAATPPMALRDICRPHLKHLADDSGDMVYLTVRSGLDGVCIAREGGRYALPSLVHDVGRHRPLNVGASGIALLAALPDDEVERLCRANAARTQRKNPRFNEAALRQDIAAVRRRGFSLIKVLESPTAFSMGMSVRFPDGRPAAGISLAAGADRLDDGRIAELVPCMIDSIRAMEQQLAREAPHLVPAQAARVQ